MKPVTLLDGGMGQELVRRATAKPTPLWSAQVMLDQPELVRQIHDDYFAAGAQVATTNTYSCLHDRLQEAGKDHLFEALQETACRLACEAREANGSGLVAGALGPLGWSYRADLAPPPEEAAEQYAEIVKLQSPHVDFHLAETMAGVEQSRGCLMGACISDKPVWLAVTIKDDDGSRLRSGEPLTEILPLIAEFNPAALLVNCSTPEAVTQSIPLIANCGVPVGAYANGFTHIKPEFTQAATVDKLEARTDLDPKTYADFVERWIADGAEIVGGCCEVGPDHIREIANRLHEQRKSA